MIRLIMLLLMAAFQLAATCLTVAGPRVRGKDVAPYVSGINPDLDLTSSPLSGQLRWFAPAEVVELAARLGETVAKPQSSFCVRRAASERVKPGDQIELEVRAGAAVIRLAARVETEASMDGSVWVRETASGRKLRAVVESSGKAVIQK